MSLGFDILLFLLLYAFLSLLENYKWSGEKKVVCKLGLLHRPMTLAGLRKTESGTRVLRKLQLMAMWETFHGRTTAKAYNVPGKPGAVHSVFTLALFHLGQM